MLSAAARSRLCVVLVGARNPQNIGAVARAMQDFGFGDLRVVNGFGVPFEAAQMEAKSAVGAGEVMRAARLFAELAPAIADCERVVGTTAIGGRGLQHPVHSLQSFAPEIVEQLGDEFRDGAAGQGSRVALLFGSEKTGLTNEQLSHCSALVTIPLLAPQGRHLSMNLGQSVAVCLYELTRDGFEGARELPGRTTAGATAGDRERLVDLLLELMQRSGYTRRFPANGREEIVRRLAGQLGETRDEAATWMGILRLLQRELPEQP